MWLKIFRGPTGRLAAGLLLAEFVTALQALVVATILPQVARNLNGYTYYGFAISGYLAAQCIVTPFAGSWADRIGVRRALFFTYPVLILGLAFSGSAPTMVIFIAARVLEGAGGGMDAVIGFSAVAKMFPEDQRSRILALFSTAWAVPAVAGPTIGALIAQTVGWRWAFYGFIPLVALAAVLVLQNVGDTPRSHSHPMDPLRILFSRAVFFAQRGFPAAIAAFFLLFAAFFCADNFVPLYLVHERGEPLFVGGLAIALSALGWSLSSLMVPRLRTRCSTSTLVHASAILLILSCATLATAAITPIPIATILACWAVAGTGIGVAYTTIFSDVFEAAEGGREGTATSVALMAALLGMACGTGLGGLALMTAQHAGYSIRAGLFGAFCVALASGLALLSIAHRQAGVPGRIPA